MYIILSICHGFGSWIASLLSRFFCHYLFMSVLVLAFKCIILGMKEECFDCIIKVVAEMQSKFIVEIYCTKNWRPPSLIKAPEDISL